MVFLNPSILLGLFAASIPILIHIINFRKLKKVEFSTLAFLKELQKSRIKKIKIKQWLLLLIRTLIIIFLILAFAKPTIENVNFAGSTSTAKSSTAFILDNSFSMSSVEDDGSIFSRAKKTAKEIISKMHDGDEFIIYFNGDSIPTTKSKETAINNIEEISISFLTESIEFKISEILKQLEKSQNINKEIFLFSDYQASTFFPDKIDTIINNTSEKEVKLYSFDMSGSNIGNYSVSDFVLENSIVEINKSLSFTSKVSNFSNGEVTNLVASLFLNDKRVAQQSIDLKENEKKIVRFETTLNKTGLIEARVELEDDNINHDNTAYLNFIVPEAINILLLYENLSDIKFIETALNSSSTSGQIKITKNDIARTGNYTLSNYNMVVLVASAANQINGIKRYLDDGGKLLFIPPETVEQSNFKLLEESIYLPPISNVISNDPNAKNYVDFGKINISHPIFVNLFNNKDSKTIDSPNIYKYLKFSYDEKVNSIISLIDGSVFLGEYSVGKGTVLFLNTSASLSWSNLPFKGIFAPLISRIIYYLSSKNENNTVFYVGEIIPINVSQLSIPLIDIHLPLGNEKYKVEYNSNPKISYKNTTQVGSYKFYNDNKLLSFATVNTDPKESDLTKLDNSLLVDYYNKLFDNNYLLFDPDDNYFEKVNQARYGTELWKYLLMLVLLLAIIEMFIARSTKKDLMNIN